MCIRLFSERILFDFTLILTTHTLVAGCPIDLERAGVVLVARACRCFLCVQLCQVAARNTEDSQRYSVCPRLADRCVCLSCPRVSFI